LSLAAVLIVVFWAGLTLYSVLGGADFGAGVLHLLARDRPARRAIATAMGPVWEANHVWLVFFLAGLLTAFPRAFSALGASVLVPGALALVGIAVRGVALALRSSALFGIASVATPFGFGFTAACIARDQLAVGAFQLDVGLLAVAASAALAAAFMAVESAELAASFRRQATRGDRARDGARAARPAARGAAAARRTVGPRPPRGAHGRVRAGARARRAAPRAGSPRARRAPRSPWPR